MSTIRKHLELQHCNGSTGRGLSVVDGPRCLLEVVVFLQSQAGTEHLDDLLFGERCVSADESAEFALLVLDECSLTFLTTEGPLADTISTSVECM